MRFGAETGKVSGIGDSEAGQPPGPTLVAVDDPVAAWDLCGLSGAELDSESALELMSRPFSDRLTRAEALPIKGRKAM